MKKTLITEDMLENLQISHLNLDCMKDKDVLFSCAFKLYKEYHDMLTIFAIPHADVGKNMTIIGNLYKA